MNYSSLLCASSRLWPWRISDENKQNGPAGQPAHSSDSSVTYSGTYTFTSQDRLRGHHITSAHPFTGNLCISRIEGILGWERS